ncbi:MAG: response regulator [Lentisphaeria bacterium]|nr:response regulator [Lentisphaeria bacterium]NQZ69495.1 response regulator [Lentisphaeria bacterium]
MKLILADDDPLSLKLVGNFVRKLGYNVSEFSNGQDAWDYVKDLTIPHILILDWQMPGLDGIELCKKIKSEIQHSLYYIFLLSVRDESEDLITGLKAGANDYITKPFVAGELKCRLTTAKELLLSNAKIEEQNKEIAQTAKKLKLLAEHQAKQLIHADRLATLGTFAAGIAHEITNPVTFISGNAQMLDQFWEDGLEDLFKYKNEMDQSDQLTVMQEEIPEMLESIQNGVNRIKNIVDGLKYFSHKKEKKCEKVYLKDFLAKAIGFYEALNQGMIEIDMDIEDDFSLYIDAQELEQVLINLISNSEHALLGYSDAKVSITVSELENETLIHVEDNGPGIPKQILDEIWEPFFTTKEMGIGTGLGLSICQQIVESNNGTITAKNIETGTRFTLSFIKEKA